MLENKGARPPARRLSAHPSLALVDGVTRYPYRTEKVNRDDFKSPRRVVLPDYLRIEIDTENEHCYGVFHGQDCVGIIMTFEDGSQTLTPVDQSIKFLVNEPFGIAKDLKVR